MNATDDGTIDSSDCKEYPSQREKVAPNMNVKAITPIGNAYGAVATAYGCQNTDDMAIGDAALDMALVVATDEVVVLAHPKDTVEDILAIVTLVERNVIPFEPAFRALYDYEVTPLPEQRHHAGTHICIYQHTFLLYDFFKH